MCQDIGVGHRGITEQEVSMTTATHAHPRPAAELASRRTAGALLIVSGISFVAGGIAHPSDSGEGSKLAQLHEALVSPMWYPSHLLLLVAFGCVAAAIIAIASRSSLGPRMRQLLRVQVVIIALATIGMALHLLTATGAVGLESGEPTLQYHLQVWNETILDTLWGLSIATLAVAGGITRVLGNRYTLLLGLVGGLSFALASATIAFIDTFDVAYQVASLIGIWAVVVGVIALARRS